MSTLGIMSSRMASQAATGFGRVRTPRSVLHRQNASPRDNPPSSWNVSLQQGRTRQSHALQVRKSRCADPIVGSAQQEFSQDGSQYAMNGLWLLPLTAVLGFVAASVTGGTDTGPSSMGGAKLHHRGGGGGGGGGGSNNSGNGGSSPFSLSRQKDEETVKAVEDNETIQKPLMVSVGTVQGSRWTMEDEYKIANGGRFAACFDGHGGNDVSIYLRDYMYDLYTIFLKQKFWEEEETYKVPSIASHVSALRSSLEEIDRRVLRQDHMSAQGSTAVAVVVHLGEHGERTLLSANVGDSRAILSRNGRAIDLTRDHKPNEERERDRILAMGEEVKWDPHAHVHRVRNLSLSRAIGDSYAKPVVIGEPEIQHFPLIDDDSNEFFLLASDGLWDVMTSQEVIDFVHRTIGQALDAANGPDTATVSHILKKHMAKRIAKEALIRGSGDNVCVVLVWLNDLHER